jgi:hypothetical protein
MSGKEVDPFNRPGFVQIGWLAEAIEDDGDLEDFMAMRDAEATDIDALGEYDGTEDIHHSHGPIMKPFPVYIPWEQP